MEGIHIPRTFFYQSRTSAGSETEPDLEPLLSVLTAETLASAQRNRFYASSKSSLIQSTDLCRPTRSTKKRCDVKRSRAAVCLLTSRENSKKLSFDTDVKPDQQRKHTSPWKLVSNLHRADSAEFINIIWCLDKISWRLQILSVTMCINAVCTTGHENWFPSANTGERREQTRPLILRYEFGGKTRQPLWFVVFVEIKSLWFSTGIQNTADGRSNIC